MASSAPPIEEEAAAL
jgi:hypothetical protein